MSMLENRIRRRPPEKGSNGCIVAEAEDPGIAHVLGQHLLISQPELVGLVRRPCFDGTSSYSMHCNDAVPRKP